MSDHKTNQAMLPPDPDGHNLALDRAAAEHLREVAPGLAPPGPRDWPEDRAHENGNYWNECGTCHGMFIGHKRRVTCRACHRDVKPENAPAPPQPEPDVFDPDRGWVTERPAPAPPAETPPKPLSQSEPDAFAVIGSDGFDHTQYEVGRYGTREEALSVVSQKTREHEKGQPGGMPDRFSVRRVPGSPPATPAEAPPERDALGRLCVDGLPHSWATDPSGARFCGVCQHPPAEATREMSREAFESYPQLLVQMAYRYVPVDARDEFLAAVDVIRRHDAALRASREAKRQRADRAERLIAGVQPDERATLAVNILRVWPRAEIETFARHLLGDREQESLLLGQLQTQLEIVTRERDEAREQRDDLSRQLPERMKHCTILFRECEKGHGRLIGANWTDSGCPWCLLAAAKGEWR